MLDIMYDLPSEPDVKECVIIEQVVTSGEYPVILYRGEGKKSA